MDLYTCSSKAGKIVTVAIDMVTEAMDEDNNGDRIRSSLLPMNMAYTGRFGDTHFPGFSIQLVAVGQSVPTIFCEGHGYDVNMVKYR